MQQQSRSLTTKVFKLKWTSLAGMGLSFYQLNNKHDSGQFTATIVPLITKRMWIPSTYAEDTLWVCPYAMLDGHGITETYFSRGKEYGINGIIPCLYHLENLTKLINIGWGVSFSEPKFKSDGVKASFRNEFPREIGEWICLLIRGSDTPKTPPLPSRAGGY